MNGRRLVLLSRFFFLSLIVAITGCAQTNFQQYEGRNGAQIIEGEGGTKEIIDGIEYWGTGTPPRRYQILGVVTIEDFDNVFGNQRIRHAIADQVKAAGGDAAIAMDFSGGGQSMGVGVNSRGTVSSGTAFGKKSNRYLIVKYLDKRP
ncbi:MAG: hypothetical protein EPO06_09860 [Burkholderiaceae bacterium]|nr:MAG: hypothetical protein EPO06_09860 [Burkholderiaceae bacterium]